MFPTLTAVRLSLPSLRLIGPSVLAVFFCLLAGPPFAQTAEQFPLGRSLQVLERDLTSPEYAEVLDTMIPTDLAAEWKRVATADNHEVFLKEHGGLAAVKGDPALRAAWERRQKIAADFLDLMRAAYTKRGLKAPFDAGEQIDLLELGRQSASTEPRAPLQVVMPAAGSERQWPRFRGPDGQGTVFDTAIPLEWGPERNIAWSVELPGKGNSSPVVWNDRLFLTTATEDGAERSIHCFDRNTGNLRWKLTVEAPEGRETLYWKNTFASSTVATDGERVIAFLGNAGLVCCDFDGHELWRRDLGRFETMHGPGTSPLINRDRVFLVQDQTRGESLFAAFDKTTGRELWRHKRPGAACWTTPVVLRVDDHEELVVNGSGEVIGYDPETGKELWKVRGSSIESVPNLVIGGGLIYSTSGRNGPIIAIRPGARGDATATHIQWQLPRGGPHVPSPLFHDGRLYIVNDMGIATCLAAETGELLWQTRLRGKFSMSPLEVEGRILVTNESGTTYVLASAPEFRLLAENELNDGVLATPAVVGGCIYFRTGSRLICVAAAK